MRIKLKVDGYEYDVPPPVGDILVKHGLAETDRLWKTTYEAAMEGLVASRGDTDAHPFARALAAQAADAALKVLDKVEKQKPEETEPTDDDLAFADAYLNNPVRRK